MTFGNPMRIVGKRPDTAGPNFAARWDDFCSSGDPVCADGVNAVTHVAYAVDGDAEKGAKFAAEHVLAYKF
ncbi:cutinase family protein [Streptomyces sp. NPDC048179]|uniref:cutinase family protein n=1 Tax=Streptomyces sp. NPDC048179 TaxID=3365506 RepID=UPI003711ADD7